MPHPMDISQLAPQAADDPVDRILLHLRRHPQDLVDSRRLMRDFQVSVPEFCKALVQLEQENTTTHNLATPQ